MQTESPDVIRIVPPMLFACLYLPRRPDAIVDAQALVALARDFSPRIEVHAPHLVTLDVSGLRTLLGPPRAIGDELRKSAADRGLYAHVCVCASRAAAVVLAAARAGLTIVDAGGDARALAPLPLRALEAGLPFMSESAVACLDTFKRWGLKTIGDVAVLSPVAVFERMGAAGLSWHHLASGADPRPLVPDAPDERFEETLELEWPIEGLEPLSFVLGRLLDPLCAHLERRDRGVAVLHVRLRLVTREIHARRLELPAPIRDARALRTLALLDLESHPPSAAIDAVTVAADPTPGRVLQYSLLTRALPAAERVSTLVARLTALIGEGRVGSPALIDSYRPGAFVMTTFSGSVLGMPRAGADDRGRLGWSAARGPQPGMVQAVLRRFRHPIAARVAIEGGRPVRMTTDRRGFGGGRVESCAGPWRSSGDWWHAGVDAAGLRARGSGARQDESATGLRAPGFGPRQNAGGVREDRASNEWVSTTRNGYGVYGAAVPNLDRTSPVTDTRPPRPGLLAARGAIVPDPASTANDRDAQADYIYALNFLVRERPVALMREHRASDGPLFPAVRASAPPWNVDEWDVALTDGALYRIVRDRETDRWYVSGVID